MLGLSFLLEAQGNCHLDLVEERSPARPPSSPLPWIPWCLEGEPLLALLCLSRPELALWQLAIL